MLSYEGQTLSDGQLQALLAKFYAPSAPADELRAVQIQEPPATEHDVDAAVRAHILASAAAAKAWVVPVFSTSEYP